MKLITVSTSSHTRIQGVFNRLNACFFLNRRMRWEEVVGHAIELTTKGGLAKRGGGDMSIISEVECM